MEAIEVEVRPRSPYRLPALTGGDRLIRKSGPGLERLLIVEEAPVLIRVRPSAGGHFRFIAEPVMPESIDGPGSGSLVEAGEDQLASAIGKMRFAVGIDFDLNPIRQAFGDDPLLGPAINCMIPVRPNRRPDPWEALVWAITEQLISYREAVGIQRSMIRKWGLRLEVGTRRSPRGKFSEYLSTVPAPQAVAGAAPAELEGCGLSARRAIAMTKVAREVATGRCEPASEKTDRRLLAISEIGPWTIACLGLRGRGDPDALLAGDLGQVKLVGYLEGLGRNAEVEEVETFYERYRPMRGLAGEYLLAIHANPLHGPGNTARIRRGHRGIRRAA